MKKILIIIFAALILFYAEVNAETSDVDKCISKMMNNVNGTELKNIDGKPGEFEQKVLFDEKTNTFIHFLKYQAFFLPGYGMMLDDMDSDRNGCHGDSGTTGA